MLINTVQLYLNFGKKYIQNFIIVLPNVVSVIFGSNTKCKIAVGALSSLFSAICLCVQFTLKSGADYTVNGNSIPLMEAMVLGRMRVVRTALRALCVRANSCRMKCTAWARAGAAQRSSALDIPKL